MAALTPARSQQTLRNSAAKSEVKAQPSKEVSLEKETKTRGKDRQHVYKSPNKN